MSSVPNRCLAAIVMALLVNAAALVALTAFLGLHIDGTLVLGLGSVSLTALLLALLLLRPLRADLAQLTDWAHGDQRTDAHAPVASARTVEASALFGSFALVQARSVQLEQTEASVQRTVEEAERLRIGFVAAMGHDLRGPLNSITGFSDLLVMEGHDAVGPSQRSSVEIIRRSAQDLLALLDQILDWARLEAGQITLDKTAVQLADVIADAVRDATARSADRGLTVEIDVAGGLPALNADPARLAQALLGLMDHATRAADRPRVELRARVVEEDEKRPQRVSLELRDPQLSVREADQGSFFEAFRPSYAPSGRRVAGLGLGPALARALIRAHGGQVWFASRADTGTTFTVELPIAVH